MTEINDNNQRIIIIISELIGVFMDLQLFWILIIY